MSAYVSLQVGTGDGDWERETQSQETCNSVSCLQSTPHQANQSLLLEFDMDAQSQANRVNVGHPVIIFLLFRERRPTRDPDMVSREYALPQIPNPEDDPDNETLEHAAATSGLSGTGALRYRLVLYEINNREKDRLITELQQQL
ncbi:hypothetical protein L227DRAFT_568793 [Lentinus tigrinus ALCF2SS1-6]|uniref:Uncharacterized protein n=1 Tax=Lentinus tigrinus ALCF2SS1-6 TaxID=1328759 RepID=A0A5C2RNM6_9APHY|nr:hypothetical protein L227DRAFT_568793 [Lentinus tigrinus ALCF2SS1-6]